MTRSSERERQRVIGRRALIKWSLATGAALGLPRWKVFEVLGLTGGNALADEAACAPTNRSVHVVGGRGGFAWFQLLWPHNDVAAARDDNLSWHSVGEEMVLSDTHKPLTVGPDTPWKSVPGHRQVTALMAGNNETHTAAPQSTQTVAMNTDLFATCAAIQTSSPTLTPVIAIDDVPYRDADGAPRAARVGSADDIIALFNAAASRAGGLLESEGNADLYQTTYSAWMSLRRAAGQPAQKRGLQAGTTSAKLLGTNLADALQPSNDDYARYGIDGSSRSQNRELAKALIVTAKAFKHGLTNCVIVPAFRDDPHGAFADMPGTRRTVQTLGRTLDAFLEDLQVEDPTCQGTNIADNTVMTFNGDTPKTPLQRGGWPDRTPGDSNWIYVLGAARLKTGWFGGIQRDGTVVGWSPQTGEDDPGMGSQATSNAAAAAVAYAVSKGDMRRVMDFYRGDDINGVVNDPTT